MELYDPPGVRTAHGASRHKRDRYGGRRIRRPFLRSTRAPLAQIVVVLVALVLVGRLAWQGVKYLRGGNSPRTAANSYYGGPAAPNAATSYSLASPEAMPYPGTVLAPGAPDPWLFDAMSSIDEAQRDAASGNLSQAEVAIDRAGVVLTTMRLESRDAPPAFFATMIGKLDELLRAHPDDARLLDHVTDTRTDLADLRSALVAVPAQPASVKRILTGGPRAIAARHLFDPAALGADYLDATPMPDTMEMLTVPSSRLFTDEVRVENLTLAGAAQTLDGVHWRNVTFIGTHLRYEGGELDLQNVHFVKCRFGVTTDNSPPDATPSPSGAPSFALSAKGRSSVGAQHAAPASERDAASGSSVHANDDAIAPDRAAANALNNRASRFVTAIALGQTSLVIE